ncbi:MAG: choice-of-anchor B family protein, partial [Bacteroidota bacterium]
PILFVFASTILSAQTPDLNLTFRSQLDFTNNYSNLWGYVDTLGNEYALLGTWQGVSIINVTIPDAPVTVANIPSAVPTGGSYVWREIKIFNHHAYVTNEKDSAVLIIDLSNLPNSNISYHHFFSNDLKTAHTCFVDENGILYLFGFNTYSTIPQAQRGAMLFDLNSNPDQPQYIGEFNGAYIHDGFVRGDTLWASEVYEGKLVIYDVSNPLNFVQIGQVTTPLAFTHNSWPTHDNHYTFTTDEKPNSSLTSYDVSNLPSITKLDQVQSNPGSQSIIHNVHLYNDDFAVVSYYRDGVVIFDISDPSNMIQSGSYDTSPLSGNGFEGDWGVYPWLPSGNIIASDIQGGLFVFSPHYQRACRVEGTVTDTVTNG